MGVGELSVLCRVSRRRSVAMEERTVSWLAGWTLGDNIGSVGFWLGVLCLCFLGKIQ